MVYVANIEKKTINSKLFTKKIILFRYNFRITCKRQLDDPTHTTIKIFISRVTKSPSVSDRSPYMK